MMTANNKSVQMLAIATDGVRSMTTSSVVLRIARCVPKIAETMTIAMIIGPAAINGSGFTCMPAIPVSTPSLRPYADTLARRVARFAWAIERALVKHREAILERQYVQERIADAAIALVTASCTLARLDRALDQRTAGPAERSAAQLYLRMANRRFDQALRDLDHNDDPQTTEAAEAALRTYATP